MDPTTPAAAANTVNGKYGESFTQPLAIIQRTISMSCFRFGHVVVFSPHGDTIPLHSPSSLCCCCCFSYCPCFSSIITAWLVVLGEYTRMTLQLIRYSIITLWAEGRRKQGPDTVTTMNMLGQERVLLHLCFIVYVVVT